MQHASPPAPSSLLGGTWSPSTPRHFRFGRFLLVCEVLMPPVMELPAVMSHLVLLLLCCCSAADAFSGPSAIVCADSRAPVFLPEPLSFCGNVGLSCCNPADDAAIREKLGVMNVPESDDAACVTIVKAILCQRCIPSPSPQPVNAATINSIPPRCISPPTPSSSSAPRPQQDGICIERLAAATAGNTYLGMAAHPDGSDRAFLYTQEGKIWLVRVPPRGSGAAINVAASDGAPLVLDLTGRVLMLTGLALHPEFATNGRFFISYAAGPPRNQLVLAELSVNPVEYGMATRSASSPTEVRKIFTMSLPQTPYASYQRYGGQIFFGPGHGYIYLITGHGGDEGTSPFLGKIIRFDVDSVPGSEPEIFATGPSNPRGCSFDSERSSHLYCAGVDEQGNEQVYLISDDMGAANDSASTAKAAVSLIIDHGRPTAGEAPSIAGGIVYRGPDNPPLNGRYLYIYGSSLWAAAETPASNGLVYAASRIPNVRCSGISPVPCGGMAIAGNIVSFVQGSNKDAFIITTGGIYRLTPPSLCGGAPPHAPPRHKAASSWLVWAASVLGSATPFVIYFICSRVFGGSSGGEQATPARNYYFTWNCCFAWTCCFCGNTNDETSALPIGGQGGKVVSR